MSYGLKPKLTFKDMNATKNVEFVRRGNSIIICFGG